MDKKIPVYINGNFNCLMSIDETLNLTLPDRDYIKVYLNSTGKMTNMELTTEKENLYLDLAEHENASSVYLKTLNKYSLIDKWRNLINGTNALLNLVRAGVSIDVYQ